jgi:hypothetical protein
MHITDDRLFMVIIGIISVIALIIASYGLATQANEKLTAFEDVPAVQLIKPGDGITLALEKLETRAILGSIFSIPESTPYTNPNNTSIFAKVLPANSFALLGTNIDVGARFIYVFPVAQTFTLTLKFSQPSNSYLVTLPINVPLSTSPGFVITYTTTVTYYNSNKTTLSFWPTMYCAEATTPRVLLARQLHDFDLTKEINVECFVTISDLSQTNLLTLEGAFAAYGPKPF